MIQLQVLNKVLSEKSISLIDSNGLTDEYFEEYKEEFDFIINHYSRYGIVPDVESVLESFPGFNILDVNETDLYLIEKLREEHMFNSMVPILNTAAQEMQIDSKEAISNLLPKIQQLIETNQFVGGVDIAKQAKERLEWARKIKEHVGTHLGISTGFELLDEITSGLLPGEELFVIVGRPGQGKSWTIDKMISNAWQEGHNVLLYSGEMSEMQVGSRIDTLVSNISINSITKGIWTDYAFKQYEEHIEAMSQADNSLHVVTPFMLGGRPMTVPLLENMIRKYKPDIVGIDQLSLMKDARNARQTRDQYANISKDLYDLSSRLKIPIILNVQASRASKENATNTITLEGIAESDAVGQNASRVLSMVRDEANSILELSLVKNRYGADNKTIEYVWDVDTGNYTLLGYKDDEDDESADDFKKAEGDERRIRRKVKRSTSELQRSVKREGIEAF